MSSYKSRKSVAFHEFVRTHCPRVVDHGAVIEFHEYISVQAEIIGNRDDARIDNRHSELVQHYGRVCKRALAARCIQDGFNPVTVSLFSDIDEAVRGLGVGISENFGVPGNFLTSIPQKVFFGKQFPYLVDSVIGCGGVAQYLPRCRLRFADELLAVDRIFQPAAEGAGSEFVQIPEKCRLP